MDPNATIRRALTALSGMDYQEAGEACADYSAWIARGGFAAAAELVDLLRHHSRAHVRDEVYCSDCACFIASGTGPEWLSEDDYAAYLARVERCLEMDRGWWRMNSRAGQEYGARLGFGTRRCDCCGEISGDDHVAGSACLVWS